MSRPNSCDRLPGKPLNLSGLIAAAREEKEEQRRRYLNRAEQ